MRNREARDTDGSYWMIRDGYYTLQKLTEVERKGILSRYNLADGHAHQGLSSRHAELLAMLSEVYSNSEIKRQKEVESNLATNYYMCAGQIGALRFDTLFHYSSSLVIEAIAHVLKRREGRVGLMHPTFDNLADILKRVGLDLMPVEEEQVLEEQVLKGLDALFLVLPNNPTGFELSHEEFTSLCSILSRHNILLILDKSFRFFERENGWDAFQILERFEMSFLVIEDTGKTWDLNDVKCGFLTYSDDLAAEVIDVFDDMLLNVSPFILSLISRAMEIDLTDDDPLSEYRGICRRNRESLERVLQNSHFKVRGDNPCMSVALVEAQDESACSSLLQRAANSGLYLLPGGPFWWNDHRGGSFFRATLMREPDYFDSCMDVFAGVVHDHDYGRME